MKNFGFATLTTLLLTQSSYGAHLFCRSVAGDQLDSVPNFSISAKVDDAFAKKAELTGLSEVTVMGSTQEKTIEKLSVDESYKPRTNKNRVRLNFDFDVSDNMFDGIAHGVLLPKVLTKSDVVSVQAGAFATETKFKAFLLSSTDSYHDGIISYFPMTCRLLVDKE